MINRRTFLLNSIKTSSLLLAASGSTVFSKNVTAKNIPQKIIVFSKQLEWITDYQELADTVAEIGFDGLELTTRPAGHVLPERVEEDLPKMAEAARKANIEITMIATRITEVESQHTIPTLKTARDLQIPFYRMGGLSYRKDQEITKTLENYKAKFRDLSKLNQEYHIHGAYQSHAGSKRVSAASWDLWYLLKDLDPQWIGCEYDTRHTQLENGSWWPAGIKLLQPYIRTMVAKDFKYIQRDGKYQAQNCPLGEGVVDFKNYFSLIKELNIQGPISLHFPWSSAENLNKLNHQERKRQTIKVMREKGLIPLKKLLNQAGLA